MFDFTYQERQVILFLTTIAFFGVGINFLGKKYTRIKTIYSYDLQEEKLCLNKADKEDLMQVKGIGEKIALRIIEYRAKNNGFASVDELKHIPGINNYRFEKLKENFILE